MACLNKNIKHPRLIDVKKSLTKICWKIYTKYLQRRHLTGSGRLIGRKINPYHTAYLRK